MVDLDLLPRSSEVIDLLLAGALPQNAGQVRFFYSSYNISGRSLVTGLASTMLHVILVNMFQQAIITQSTNQNCQIMYYDLFKKCIEFHLAALIFRLVLFFVN
jgi:hypothetical protein